MKWNCGCHGTIDMQGSASGGESDTVVMAFSDVLSKLVARTFAASFPFHITAKEKSNHGSSRIASRRHGQHVELYVNHSHTLRAF